MKDSSKHTLGKTKKGLTDFRKTNRSYKDRLTEDQKKFRILRLLINSNKELVSWNKISGSLVTGQPNFPPQFFLDMVNEKWIYKENTSGGFRYKIGEQGEIFINFLRNLKTTDSGNPLLKLDIFNMTELENKQQFRKDKFNENFSIESIENLNELNEFKKLLEENLEKLTEKIESLKNLSSSKLS